ncbi:MAG: hypothetical protein HY049_16785 [Acidobacteria bacterium]|nr:hypothetical protein [Acidobacteriota bacterium]
MSTDSGSAGRVVAVVSDLFFKSKIRETAAQAGVPLAFASTGDDLARELGAGDVTLVVIDLGIRTMEAASAIEAAVKHPGIRTVGYVSHVDDGAQSKARAAGCELILAKSAFSKDLPRILTRGAAPGDRRTG